MENTDIKGIIFDYGGTIDSRGEHWSHIIRRSYTAAGIEIGQEKFREAYVHAERLLAMTPLVKPWHDFGDMMEIKIRAELEYLAANGHIEASEIKKDKLIAGSCYSHARECTSEAAPILRSLSMRFPMVMVSNFYGNLNTVLKDFRLEGYFTSVIESATVGLRKPDPRIFALGVEALGFPADKIIVVGDSIDKDMVPAESIGCRTVWLKGRGWDDTGNAAQCRPCILSLSELANTAL